MRSGHAHMQVFTQGQAARKTFEQHASRPASFGIHGEKSPQ